MSAPTAPRYTRVTLAGSRRRVDVVMPSDETVGQLLPEVIRLTGEPPTSPPSLRHLAALDGTLLDADATLAEAGVPDGALLRLVGLADAPPPPVVHDVVEETADDLDRRSWRWGPQARHGLAATVLALGGLFVAYLAAGALHGAARTAVLVAAPATLLVLGAVLGRLLPAPIGLGLLLTGAATGGYAALMLGAGVQGLAGTAALLVLGLGLGTELGRGALIGGATGLALVAGWTIALAGGVAPTLAAAGAAVVSIGALGLLPRLALLSSGLTALDDRRSQDAEVSRRDVTVALTAAHRGLALAAIAAGVSAGIAGCVLGARPTPWTVALAVLLVMALVLRARSFPLAAPVATLAIAAAATVIALVKDGLNADATNTWPTVAAVTMVTLVAFAGLMVDPPDHVRARVRRLADRLELIAVVASVPVALGVSGIYGHLLTVF